MALFRRIGSTRLSLAVLLVMVLGSAGAAPVEQHREIAQRLPDSRLAVFEVCGHMSPMERPDAVACELARCLAIGRADGETRSRLAEHR